jgi:hypothetical protein
MLTKIDLKREQKPLFQARKTPGWVDVPSLNYLTIEGTGAPAGPAFAEAIPAIYSAAYTLKFGLKKSGELDYPVMPLQAFWWMAGNGGALDQKRPDDWRWKLMILTPDDVTPEMLERAVTQAAEKKPELAGVLGRVRLERFEEGPCAQVLHVGPYAAEQPTIDALHQFITAAGRKPAGRHHEIYLSDPNRTAPERLKTIIRCGWRR